MNKMVDRIYQILHQATKALSFDELLSESQLSNFDLMNSLGTLSTDGKVQISESEGKLFFSVV